MGLHSSGIDRLARALLACEAAIPLTPHGESGRVLHAYEKLREPLCKLIGVGGFVAMASKALVVAKRRSPTLHGLRIAVDGSLDGFDENQSDKVSAEAIRQGGVVLLTELLSLLASLIGEALTLRLIQEACPDMPCTTRQPKNDAEKPQGSKGAS